MKNKYIAAVLAFFLGGIGIHKFYLGKTLQGFVYLALCWTYVPTFIALVEAIIYLTMSESDFDAKYNIDSSIHNAYPSNSYEDAEVVDSQRYGSNGFLPEPIETTPHGQDNNQSNQESHNGSNIKYCPNCGAENDVNNKFCESCGNKF